MRFHLLPKFYILRKNFKSYEYFSLISIQISQMDQASIVCAVN